MTDWNRAACHGADPNVFFPTVEDETVELYEYAKRRYCDRCPISSDCLTEAMRIRADYGMWGGTTPGDRENLRKNVRTVQRTPDLPRNHTTAELAADLDDDTRATVHTCLQRGRSLRDTARIAGVSEQVCRHIRNYDQPCEFTLPQWKTTAELADDLDEDEYQEVVDAIRSGVRCKHKLNKLTGVSRKVCLHIRQLVEEEVASNDHRVG